MAGDYEGHATLAELMKHGDFGMGTIEPLDGELAILDGVAYQIAYNGTVRVLPGSTRTPFASVAFFKPDRTTPLDRIPTLGEMERRLDASLPSPNFFYALRVDGRFSFVKTRSVPRQSRPYPPLAEVSKAQSLFEFHDVEGTLLGIRCPVYAKGVNFPGYHWHFLTADRKGGGHVLDLSLDGLSARIQTIREFSMVLPEGGDFLNLDFNRDMSKETKAVEGERSGGGQ